ncbi:uncharacterized protein TRAVEDRAFT_48916 [Trametes versicolor FP-101664 SS1]|uniref:uncharacterized protein n=1 Tax=Trametes versicolor (strain FP-101664) TaxID=717944 RepID=UPI0004624903|nr:uncharacterized protein TRAVEDRAFT_48916 [Trametes versicolor FP-101664 SS1]EIW57895.1 hypothetical protein TRAVEDRAFT_48916 [Trametes versicolor FP-101664 SS1]
MTAALPQAPRLDNTMGVILLCTCIGCMLFGLTTHQTYRYFRLYPSDVRKLKVFVVLLLLFDIFHTVLCVHICYYYLINNYFFPPRLLDGVWSIRLTVMETGCVILLAHSFYARRLYLLGGGQRWPVVFIATLLAIETGMCIAATVEAFLVPAFAEFAHFAWITCTGLGIAVILDVFVAGSLSYYLHRSRTGFKRTDSLIDILMVYSINTGLSTSMVTLVAAISAITMRNNLVYSGLYIIASKLYANSLLALLNSRRSIIDKGMEGFETGSFGLKVVDTSNVRAIAYNLASPTTRTNPAQTVIDVRVTKETYHDGLPLDRDGAESDATSDDRKRPSDSAAALGEDV